MDIEFTLILHSFLLGSLIFFVCIVSPAVFKTLNDENSRSYLRLIFPRMFLYGFVISFLSIISASYEDRIYAFFISFIISLGFLFNLFILTPNINKTRDLCNLGNLKAKKKFKIYHLVSVLIFVMQVLMSGTIIIYYSMS